MAQRECYFISGSPPCWSVMLALAAKGLTYEPHRLSNSKSEQKNVDFLAINPRGNVPVLVDGAVRVRETNAILAYLEAAYPQPPLFGVTPADTAAIWQTVCEAGDRLRTPIGNAVRPIFRGRAEEQAATIQVTMETVHQELATLEAQLNESPYLCGNHLSAADITVYPAMMQLLRGATREGAEVLELGVLPLATHYPGIHKWTGLIEDLPGYETAYPPHWR